MILVWLAIAPVSMMMPRYFKGYWDNPIAGNAAYQAWFVIHVALMLLGVVLSTLGGALVVTEAGADPFSKDLTANPHPVFGLVTMILMYIQVLLVMPWIFGRRR